MSGLKPVVELMFFDFITLAMDALVNQAAKAHFMFGGQFSVPMVVRAPHGAGLGAGPQHSQCLESWLAHVPGLKIVCPATIPDAYGLLRSAIADPDPVVVVENKSLYAQRGEAPECWSAVPIGSARIVRRGGDVTIVTYGAMLQRVEAAGAELQKMGIDTEIVDLRSLQPWDEQTIRSSICRTGRLAVCHEAVGAFGIGAEIVARMVELELGKFAAPPVRIAAPFMPPPFAPSLEQRFVPDVGRIVTEVRVLVQRGQ
jgi:pyruvate dehydrogenase E1 component beta subunit